MTIESMREAVAYMGVVVACYVAVLLSCAIVLWTTSKRINHALGDKKGLQLLLKDWRKRNRLLWGVSAFFSLGACLIILGLVLWRGPPSLPGLLSEAPASNETLLALAVMGLVAGPALWSLYTLDEYRFLCTKVPGHQRDVLLFCAANLALIWAFAAYFYARVFFLVRLWL